MKDIRLWIHDKPGKDIWRLGDSIIAMSMMAHFGSVRLHTPNPNSECYERMKLLHKLFYRREFDLEVVEGEDGEKLQPDWFVIERKIPVVKANLSLTGFEPYCTTQFRAKGGNRSVPLSECIKYTEGLPHHDLSEAKYSMEDTCIMVHGAKKHVGSNSGIAWLALSFGTPLVCLMSSWHKEANDTAMIYMQQQENAEFIQL